MPQRHNNHHPVWSGDGNSLFYTTALPNGPLESAPVTEALRR